LNPINGHMIKKATNRISKSPQVHLSKVDPVMRRIIPRIKLSPLPERQNNFHTLAEIIVSQQLSGRVAEVIFNRVLKSAKVRKLTLPAIDRLTDTQLREAGLSFGKITYIRDLAEKVRNRSIPFRKFSLMSDEEIITALIQVKGIGRWSAEMYLMFVLHRPDVFSPGDLGIRTAIEKLYGITDTNEDLDSFAERWKPYRSFACFYLWRALQLESKKKN
jgi:DNA-3-methyladenine glycosylase II